MVGSVLREFVALVTVQTDETSIDKVEARLAKLKSAIGAAVVGFASVTAFDWGEGAAKFDDAFTVFEKAGGNLVKLRQETRGLVDDLKLVKSYNVAQQFGLGDKLGDFFAIADAAFKKFPGRFATVGDALDMTLTGVATHSGRLLKNVGVDIVGRTARVIEDYAKTVGKTAKDLSGVQVRTAIALEAIRQSKGMVNEVAASGATATDKFNQLHAVAKNLKISMGELVLNALGPLVPALIELETQVQELSRSPEFKEFLMDIGQALKTVFQAVTGAIYGFGKLAAALADIPLLGYVVVGVIGGYLLGSFAALAAAVIIVGLALEEFVSFFDDSKIGLFEKWSGHWDRLVEKMSKGPVRDDWQGFFVWFGREIVGMVALLASDVEFLIQAFRALSAAGHGEFNHAGDMIDAASFAALKRRKRIGDALDGTTDYDAAGRDYNPEVIHALLPGSEGPQFRIPTPGAAAAAAVYNNTNITFNNVHDAEGVRRVIDDHFGKQHQDARDALSPSKPL